MLSGIRAGHRLRTCRTRSMCLDKMRVVQQTLVDLPMYQVLLLLLLWMARCSASPPPDPAAAALPMGEVRQYCQWESFNASCAKDEIILMKSAQYGRMRFGGCVKENHGHLGCYVDVLAHTDRMCSGRHDCVISIPDATLHKIHACPKELMSYLEAQYECVKVAVTENQVCGRSRPLQISSEHGFISSAVADETGFGTVSCPWLIMAQPGQQLKLTLYNFVPPTPPSQDSDKGHFCDKYLAVKENNQVRNVSACVGDARDKVIYTSRSNVVELGVLPARKTAPELRKFLVKYEAMGCADVVVRGQAHVKRVASTAVVKCNHTDETFFLSCEDGKWIGEIGNCTKGPSWKGRGAYRSIRSFPYGILVVIGIGVALGVAMGILLLMSILIFIKRRKERRLRSATTDPLLEDNGHENDDSNAQCNCGAKIYYTSRLECQLQTAPNHRQSGIYDRGLLPHPPPDGDTRALPDMVMIERHPVHEILETDGIADERREIQTSFITFKPQDAPGGTTCKACLAGATLRRADKSSSYLPHYGKMTRAGLVELPDPPDSPHRTLHRDCSECNKNWNEQQSTQEVGNKSV